MKFITEYDLRTQFNARPYTDYHVEEGTRLTPGARQFLADRGINLFADGSSMHVGESREGQPSGQCASEEAAGPADIHRLKLAARADSLAAQFLCTSAEMVADDVTTAQKVAALGLRISGIRCLALSQELPQDLPAAAECTCGQDLEITDFFIQSPNGKAIVRLNLLRAELRLLRLEAAETFSAPEDEERLQAVDGELRAVVAAVSECINEEAGVKACQTTQ